MKIWNDTLKLDGIWQLYLEDNCVVKKIEEKPTTEKELKELERPSIPATVPGNFELDMERAGLLPDLLKELNMLKVQELENKHLWYVTRFNNPYDATERCFLRFEGIDTFAEIYLNGKLIGETDNMFIPHEIAVPEIKAGENELVVHIKPTEIEARKFQTEASTTVHWKNTASSMFVRKAPHMYGWDIMPRAITGGLWRSVSLICKAEDYIEDIYLYTATLRPNRAVIFINYQLVCKEDNIRDYRLEIKGGCGDSLVNETYDLWHTSGRIHFYVDNPKLWWTKDMGEPNLYELKVELYYKDKLIETVDKKLGIREVKLLRTSIIDENGNGEFCFKLNGEKMFVRGTNWVPLDAFHSREKERMPKALELLDESGCNMVRCWGGNVYEPQEFFDFCDEHGIAVWQDFAMACATYPKEDVFLEAIKKETESVVRNYRHHPSIFIWSGDNECDMFTTYSAVPQDPARNIVTRKIIPEVINRLDPMRSPYFLPSSPYIDELAMSTGAKTPEDHYWFRCYYKDPKYLGNAKYLSEIGYFGVPALESLRKFFSEKALENWLKDPEWIFYAMSTEITPDSEGAFIPQCIANMVGYLFDEIPDNLSDFTVASQIVQAEALKFFVEHFRIHKWEKTGIMCWNLLDGWPQTSNGFVDYYFKKKMVFDIVKTSYAPVSVACGEPSDGKISVYGINEYLQNKEIEYTVTCMDTGTVVAMGKTNISANESCKIAEFEYDGAKCCYLINWTVDGKEYNSHYLAGEPLFDFGKVSKYYETLGYYNPQDYK